jgi:hypothetical protein
MAMESYRLQKEMNQQNQDKRHCRRGENYPDMKACASS